MLVAVDIRKLKEPTHVTGVALYSADVIQLRRRAKKEKKSVSDLVREIVNKHLN